MRHSLVPALAVVALSAGCNTPAPPLKLSVATVYDTRSLTCGTVEPTVSVLTPSKVRLSARVRDAKGAVTGICDALINPTQPTVEGFPGLGAGSTVDLYVEAFEGSGDSVTRRASGALLHVDPAAASLPALRLYEAEKYSCVPRAHLAVPRAFHTATSLDNDQVLLVGGLTASSDGSDKPAAADGSGAPLFYATASIEVYDLKTSSYLAVSDAQGAAATPRAFHHAALLGGAAGKYQILLMGGVTPVTAGMPVASTLPRQKPPLGFRMAIDPTNGAAAPAELLEYDATTTPPTVKRTMAPMALQQLSTALQGGAQLRGAAGPAGMVVAGGFQTSGGVATVLPVVGATTDGQTATSGLLSQKRVGASLLRVDDPTGVSTGALLVGGVAGGLDTPPPFERIGLLSTPTTTPLGTTLGTLPIYLFPTVTWMDDPRTAAPRLLISGGLELVGSETSNPPAAMGTTMFQVTYSATAGTLEAVPALLGPGLGSDDCTPGLGHFRVVAFDAALLLPPGDRLLVNGGTPRNGGACNDCEGGDNDFTCGSSQSVLVSVPATALTAPTITAAAPLTFPRFGHTLNLLRDGNVLVSGGLARRNQATWAVGQSELWNPTRVHPPTAMVQGGASVDPDDPLASELMAAGLSRTPGSQANSSSGGPAKVPCIEPKK